MTNTCSQPTNASPSVDDSIERAAATLAALLPNAVSIDFNGEACTAKFPQDYGPHEQAAFRLVTRSMLQAALSRNEAPVAWRYRNEYGEVVSEWIDGPPPEYVRDANTDERTAVKDMKIDVAYAAPFSPTTLDPVTVERCAQEAKTWQGLKGSKLAEKIRALASPVSSISPIMQAAESAQKVVDSWSDSKREYADRVTGPQSQTVRGQS